MFEDALLRPEITVVVPTYKRPALLNRCLDSLNSQSYEKYEVIVVDNDGDNPEIEKIIKQYKDRRFQYVTQSVSGVSSARNKGIELATAPLILFVDDDDEIEPDMLSELVDFMSEKAHRNLSFTWCGVKKLFEDRNGDVSTVRYFKVTNDDLSNMSFIIKIGTGCGLCVRKNDLLEVGCFDEGYKLSEDRDLILKLIEAGKNYKPLNKFLYKRYYHCGDRLSETFHSLIEAKHDYKLYYEHLNFIVSHQELRLRLLDLRAKHYFVGGELEKAIDVQLHALQIKPFRLKAIRRLAFFYMKMFFSVTKEKVYS